ncbi:MAG: hypothetical protein LBH56_02665 [Coriobacteriales bacterium]|jgi:hypothetical protein|nr:hypothetical protein [Coriobacteriales bacterium]
MALEMTELVMVLLANVGMTLCLEGVAAALICRKRAVVLASVLGNLLTCPALNFIVLVDVHFAGAAGYLPLLVCLEVAAVLVEAWVYTRSSDMKLAQALMLSLGLNLLSLSVGIVVHGL